MKVILCVLLLELVLLETCVFASVAENVQSTSEEQKTEQESATSYSETTTITEIPRTEQGNSLILPCTSLAPPSIYNYTNASLTEDPTITWNISSSDCSDRLSLSINCTSIDDENEIYEETIDVDANANLIVVNNLSMNEATYRCYGKLITDSLGSDPSETFWVSTWIAGTDEITIVRITPSATNIFVKWDSSIDQANYSVAIRQLNALHYSPDCGQQLTNTTVTEITNQMEFNFTEALPDHNYSVVISADVRGNNITSNVSFVSTTSGVPDAPRNVSISNPDVDDGSPNITKILSWNMPCFPNGPIHSYKIEFSGIYTLNNSIKDNRNSSHYPTAIEDSFRIEIVGLWASTRYDVSVKAVGENGESGSATGPSFETRDAIPISAPNIIIASQSSSHLDIHWELSDDIHYGKITNYTVDIRPLGPAYGQLPENCPSQDPITLTTNITNYNFTGARAYYKYSISVSATTSEGTGPTGNFVATTNTSVLGAPRNIILADPDLDDGSPNVTKFITWDVPCFPNGKIENYLITLTGRDDFPNDHREIMHPATSNQNNFNITVENLRPSTWYTLTLRSISETGEEGMSVNANFTTRDAFPGTPVFNEQQFIISNSSFNISWDAPREKLGKIVYYKINIFAVEPRYFIPENCPAPLPVDKTNVTVTESMFYVFSQAVPYYRYKIELAAATQRGLGAFVTTSINTTEGVPENVQNLSHHITNEPTQEYSAYVTFRFKLPCYTYGQLKSIKSEFIGKRYQYPEISGTQYVDITDGPFLEIKVDLQPEYSYAFSIVTENDEFWNIESVSFEAPAGVPPILSGQPIQISSKGLHNAYLTIKNKYFDSKNGEIKYISLILSQTNGIGDEFGSWNGVTWPRVSHYTAYQLTQDFWKPFENSEVSFTIGDGSGCNKTVTYCNKPLEEKTKYYLIIRIFTKNFYRDSPAIVFETDKSWTSFILGLILGLLLSATLAIIGYLLWKKGTYHKIMKWFSRKSPQKPKLPRTQIPCSKFVQYCRYMDNNPQTFQELYKLLDKTSKEIMAEKTKEIALLLENRRKNRYTNISPYDDTRVKLQIDEDDEICSDYINASYIKGYSGKVEYIATQGPLLTTTRDFWKMILQENVTIIVMVSQFKENDKEKCHRYFPKNHESMMISDDMEIRCSTELHFGSYCVRNLQVRKDTFQVTVIHMQFLDWPDFGVPVGTETMLPFCYQLRDRVKIEGGLIAVHCSAGVGRTGTLIATDILLQCANSRKPIDVFNTVLELRRQRMFMVQTEKQYLYIHTLLKDHFDRSPTPDLIVNSEPVYENMGMIEQSEDSECESYRIENDNSSL